MKEYGEKFAYQTRTKSHARKQPRAVNTTAAVSRRESGSKVYLVCNFADETGIFHTTLFPHAFDKFCRLLAQLRPLLIGGKVEENYGAVSVNIVRMSTMS